MTMNLYKCSSLLLKQQCSRCMSTLPRVNGFVAAPYTPFTKDGDINFSVFEKCFDNFVKNHFKGLFVNGTLAEGLSQSCNERKKTAEKWMEVASDKMQIILHIGTGNLQESKELARHAEELGVTAISALPPTYYKPATEEHLVDYMEQVAAAAPNTPFIYYEYNITTGVYLNIPRFLELAEKRIQTLSGLKHTSPELHSALNCATVCDGKYQVLFGTEMRWLLKLTDTTCIIFWYSLNQQQQTVFIPWNAVAARSNFLNKLMLLPSYYDTAVIEHYLPSLSIGISDVITSPIMGSFFHDLKAVFDQGNMADACKLQRRIQQLMNIQTRFGGGIAGSKAMFELLMDISVGPPRLPLHGLTDEVKAQMKYALQAEGFISI